QLESIAGNNLDRHGRCSGETLRLHSHNARRIRHEVERYWRRRKSREGMECSFLHLIHTLRPAEDSQGLYLGRVLRVLNFDRPTCLRTLYELPSQSIVAALHDADVALSHFNTNRNRICHRNRQTGTQPWGLERFLTSATNRLHHSRGTCLLSNGDARFGSFGPHFQIQRSVLRSRLRRYGQISNRKGPTIDWRIQLSGNISALLDDVFRQV